MYRAVYAFQSEDPKTLNFKPGDKFTLLDRTDVHWWQMMNSGGKVGYVPASYIEKDQVSDDDVLKSIDRAMESIHLAATHRSGSYTTEQRDCLNKLVIHRKEVLEKHAAANAIPSQPRRKAPEPPSPVSSESKQPVYPQQQEEQQQLQLQAKRSSVKGHKAPLPPMRAESMQDKEQTSPPVPKDITRSPERLASSSKTYKAPSPPEMVTKSTSTSLPPTPTQSRSATSINVPVPENIGGELIEIVRVNTDLSFEKSRIAVGTALSHIGQTIPAVANVIEDILKTLQSDHSDYKDLQGTHDAERLEVIFSELTSCKDDSQQRSWALHEDEAIILEYVAELTSILNDANPEICKEVVSRDHFASLHSLVVYYQMESRLTIRLALLKAFGALCALDASIISDLLYSVLPMELARDMQSNTHELQRLMFSTLVCTMLLTTGEPLPYTHYDHLNESFIGFLLDKIEDPPMEDEEEQIPDLFVKLILAYNLHFQMPSDNLVMRVLSHRKTVKLFSEKIMLLVNRGEDPIKMFDHKVKTPDSLLKFLGDIFSSRDTSDIFYSNDLLVLIDIILRQLSDLSPGDEIRTECLSLIHSIIGTTNYGEHRHRCSELQRCFVGISHEENRESEQDRIIVQQIWKDYPQYFSKVP